MFCQPKHKHIPQATIRRLAGYVQALEALERKNVPCIHSKDLAKACGVRSEQVRKDLAYFGEFGTRGVGYDVKHLRYAITAALGVDHDWPLVLFGAGNLGKALINHIGFHAHGFRIQAVFDSDPFVIGEKAHGFPVLAPDEVSSVVQTYRVKIGLVATPPERAQRACDLLVSAGIAALLNFSPIRVEVPHTVHVQHLDMFRALYTLVFDLVRDTMDAAREACDTAYDE